MVAGAQPGARCNCKTLNSGGQQNHNHLKYNWYRGRESNPHIVANARF